MAHVLAFPRKADTTNSNEEVAAMAASLGLPVQAQRYSATHCIETDFQPLTDDELLIWQAFCHTAYASDCSTRTTTRIDGPFLEGVHLPLAEYKYDTIPAEVLRHWHGIKQHYAFDSYQIRTPERVVLQYKDPILIGMHGPVGYLLARWGLESPDSLPFHEVCNKLRHSLLANYWWKEWAFHNTRSCWTNRIISTEVRSPLARVLKLSLPN